MSSHHIQKNFSGLLHTPATYEKNPPYGCEAIVKRKCGFDGVASPIYKQVALDQRLDEIDIPWDALHCKDVFCTAHVRALNDFYDKIINGYITAGKECITSTSHVKQIASEMPVLHSLRKYF